MFCGWLFLILPLFCSAASIKPSIYIPKKVDEKPRNTPIDFDGQKWKFKLTNVAQLSAYFISKSPAAVSFDLFVPDPSKLTQHTNIILAFLDGPKLIIRLVPKHGTGEGFAIYDELLKSAYLICNQLLVSITLFQNGSVYFQADTSEMINMKLIVPFLDIANAELASGFTLTGTNIADFLEILFKPGNIGFDKNLDPKQPVADAFVGSIGFYVVVVIGVLIVLGLISGFIGWSIWRKRKMEKAKLLVDDKKTPNNDGKKASDVQSTEKKETNDKKAMIPKTDAEKKSKNEQKNEDKKPAKEKASQEKLKENKSKNGKEERIRVVNELAAPDERTESKMSTNRQKKSWTERKPVNEMMKTSGEISSTQVPTLDQTQEQFSAEKPKAGGKVGLKQRFRGENGPPPPRTESQRSKKKPKKKPTEKQESKKSSDETLDETDDDDTLKGVKSLEKNPNIPDTVDDAEANEK
uniref:Uncharacterized protein n=1 Tax=Panagrolaimus sp. JU765 TaxID=591449 RepID=A0AC34R0S3_9BILA